MKLLKICALVLGLHAVGLALLLSVQGCSTSKPSTTPTAAEPAGPPVVADSARIAPVPVDSAPPLAGSDLNPALWTAPTGEGRYSPTRPGAAAAAAATGPQVTPATTYEVQRGDSLWTVARRHNLTVAELAAANNLRADATLRIGQTLVIPGGVAPAAVNGSGVSSATVPSGTTEYTVRSGDTLTVIARRHGTTVSELRALNGLRNDTIRVGQTLLVPAGGPRDGAEAAAAMTAPAAAVAAAAVPAGRHTVMPGETLGEIARRYRTSVAEIARLNNITDPGRLRAGQILIVPGTAATTTPAPAAPASRPAPAPADPDLMPITPVQPVAPAADLDAQLPPGMVTPVIPVEENGAPRFD
jgi:LysM repeat protein